MKQENFDWDDAYANMAHIPGAQDYPPLWQKRGAAFRQRWQNKQIDIAYGVHPRERLDLFLPQNQDDAEPGGLVVFVHGGYWMRLDKSYWSDFAEGTLEQNYAVAIPSYTLTPENRIFQITLQIAAAINLAAEKIDGKIILSGHSAGGHLACRMICEDSALDADVLSRIAHVFSISGLHDLEPLMKTEMNMTLRLDLNEAMRESPIHHQPKPDVPVTAWVGGGERPEFIRQAGLLETVWPNCQKNVDGDHHHFSVIEGLCEPDSDITRAMLKF